eukprot:TRINITY_DN731_c1_g1_i2.p1 TRINITY_DN731_c1_g1~~TRINITY_DN731_c1_g1_i2.p1  ORF type:complete len:129 (-),score=22.31 TRINITY_DN731_c1_g1_i2:106-492(-)
MAVNSLLFDDSPGDERTLALQRIQHSVERFLADLRKDIGVLAGAREPSSSSTGASSAETACHISLGVGMIWLRCLATLALQRIQRTVDGFERHLATISRFWARWRRLASRQVQQLARRLPKRNPTIYV